MDIVLIPLYVFLGIFGTLISLLIIFLLLYILWFVAPRGGEPEDKSLLCDYAHRGLHGEGVPENSLLAFELACRAGYGIELDVQLSRDGEVMVFHDDTLVRMTGCDKRLCELDHCELQELKLNGGEQGIPTFREVLELVSGRVPILVELKGESFDTSLCPKVAELLREYNGSYCIESFNPLLLKDMRGQLPDAYYGLLYTNVVRDKKKASVINIALSMMALNFLCKPNFIAYNKSDRASVPVWIAVKLHNAPVFVWTVNSSEELDKAHALGEYPIFEKIDR